MDRQLKIIVTVTTLISLLMICSKAKADFRWSEEEVIGNIDTSLLHAVGSAYLSDSFESSGLSWWKADLLTLGLGVGWEIKDGLLPYEHYGWFGGEGFSKNDLLCNLGGLIFNRSFHYLIRRVK
jgi:hypothetical protein